MIAARAVDAALRGIDEDVFLEHGLADLFGDILFFGKRLACGFVSYKFDAYEETAAANFADVGMRFEWCDRFAKLFGGGLDASEEILFFENVENSVACGSGNGMRLVGETMLESAGTFCKYVGDSRRD